MTRTLRRYLESGGDTSGQIELFIEAVDSKGQPKTGLEWSAKTVTLETA